MNIKQRIIDIFGEKTLARSAIRFDDGPSVFEQILGSGKYKSVLEIGTYKGISAACMAQYCDRVATIDLYDGRLEQLGDDFDRQTLWDTLNLDNITLHLIRNDTEKKALISTLDFDFAFVDGAHDESVKTDFEMVRHCGAVLFHDYNKDGPEKQRHVYNLVESLPKHQVQIMGIFALWTV